MNNFNGLCKHVRDINKRAEKQDYGKVGGATSITVHSLDRGKVWKIIREVIIRNILERIMIDIRNMEPFKLLLGNYIIVSKWSCISL